MRDGDDSTDLEFIAEAAVTLFWRTSLFEDAKQRLRSLNYHTVEITCFTRDQFVVELGDGLEWKRRFGYEPWHGGLDAFDDGLDDPPFSVAGCLALCFERFDRIVAADPQWAVAVLDVIERQSRNHLVHGRRLVALVQTADGSFHTGPLGGAPASWNQAEWLNAKRVAPAND